MLIYELILATLIAQQIRKYLHLIKKCRSLTCGINELVSGLLFGFFSMSMCFDVIEKTSPFVSGMRTLISFIKTIRCVSCENDVYSTQVGNVHISSRLAVTHWLRL